MRGTATVYLVDDDAGVRTALSRMLRFEGYEVVACDSAETFLDLPAARAPTCLVLDVSMPGLDGLALQRKLNETVQSLPVVFLTGFGDIPMTVQAMKAGAVDVLTKPVEGARLFEAIRAALESQQAAALNHARRAELEQRYATLTSRERQVLAGLIAGKINKQIAADLGVVVQTVKFHRARIMQRMQATTVAELMHILAQLDGASSGT